MYIGIQVVVGGIIAVAVPGLEAQVKSTEAPLTPVTVCEILASPQQFNGMNLAILGRLDQTGEGWWLAEDDCGRKLVTEGYTWPNLIWLHCCYEPAPDPPSGLLRLDDVAMAAKLKQIRGTTELKYQKRLVVTITKDGKGESTSGWRDVKDEWAVAYGRIEARSELHPPKGSGPDRYWGSGFGHLGAAPVQLVIKQKNLQRIPDEASAGPDRNRQGIEY
jgi:hypothetical protein